MTSLAGKGSAALALLLAAAVSGSACAMSSTSTEQLRCAVQGEEKLPPEVGGEGAVCSAMKRAVEPVLQQSGVSAAVVSVSVEVKSEYRISAIASVGGRALPEQHVASTDRVLNPRAIDMLARAVASELSKLQQQ